MLDVSIVTSQCVVAAGCVGICLCTQKAVGSWVATPMSS